MAMSVLGSLGLRLLKKGYLYLELQGSLLCNPTRSCLRPLMWLQLGNTYPEPPGSAGLSGSGVSGSFMATWIT